MLAKLIAALAALVLLTGCIWHTSNPDSFGGRKYSTETVPAYSGRVGPYYQELRAISKETYKKD